MHKLKRITASLLALLTMGSLSALAACKKDPLPPLPPPDSSSSSEEEATGECAKKGHDYGDTGVCIRCEKKAPIPTLSKDTEFPFMDSSSEDAYYSALVEGYFLELEEGCFTVTIPKEGAIWLSFAVKKSGQYVLHSVDGDNDVKVTRHAANASYVNMKGVDAVVEEDNFYAFVNCGEAYYNEVWRATYCLQAAKGTQVKLRFVRIADAAWEPKSITSKVYATELTQKAQDMSEDKVLVDVPYESDYFYDETAGYYRMGTKEEPREIIYAAISKPATRLFGDNSDTSFTNVLQTSGTALNLSNGTTEDGDYKILNYKPFFMNWIDEDASWGSRPGANGGSSSEEPEGDLTKKCYQNYCNDDGVYPVNKELYEFLVLYTSQNKPTDEALTDVWGTDEDTFSWLSACYYYEQRAVGTKENPRLLEFNREITITTKLGYFYKIDGTGNYTITCSTSNAAIKFVNKTAGESLVTVQASGEDVFELYNGSLPVIDYTITITITKVEE